MYERFYNLRERPFSLSPDPDYLYPSRVHKEALSYLRYGIEGHAGFICITGEIGSGKTTLLQTALRGLDRQTSVSRLVNTMLDARELIEAVMLDFGLDPGQGRSKPHLLRDLARYLVDQRSAGRLALLVIDEAQNLSLSALEEVRMLSNLETEKSKLLQIALIGQPNLRDLMSRPELEQLRQRVTVSYHLQALDSIETAAYVNHRLKKAAIGAPLEFSRDVTDLIHLHSRGIPRKINVISDAVLLFGYGEERKVITVDLTHQALEELESTGVLTPPVISSESLAGQSAAPGADPAYAGTPGIRESDMATRETRVAQRERQLVEQQRVLAEEYRLLRLRREMPAGQAPTAVAAAAPAVGAAGFGASHTGQSASAAPAISETAALNRAPWPAPPPAFARPPLNSGPVQPRRIVMPPPAVAPKPATAAAANQGVWARLRRSLADFARPVQDNGYSD